MNNLIEYYKMLVKILYGSLTTEGTVARTTLIGRGCTVNVS